MSAHIDRDTGDKALAMPRSNHIYLPMDGSLAGARIVRNHGKSNNRLPEPGHSSER